MKVFIAGGGGFIGSHLVDTLLKRGDQVFVYDSFVTGSLENLPIHSQLTVETADVLNFEDLSQALCHFGPDVVVHLFVEPVAPPMPWNEIDTNIGGTYNLIEASIKADVKHIFYLQTAMIYGIREDKPIPLTDEVAPPNPYSVTKFAAERFIRNSPIPWTVLRVSSHYGPRNYTGCPSIFFKNLSEGKHTWISDSLRSLGYIDDLLEVIPNILTLKGLYQFSSGGMEYPILEIYLTMAKIMGKDPKCTVIPRQADSMPHMLVDDSFIRETLDINPKTPLQKGLEETIAYYTKHGIRHTITHFQEPKKNGQ